MQVRVTPFNTTNSQQPYPALMGPATFIDQKVWYEKTSPLLKHTAEGIIAVGQDMLAVQNRLSGGQLQVWPQSEFDLSLDIALNWLEVARKHGKQSANVASLALADTFELEALSTPEPVIEQVILGQSLVELPIHLNDRYAITNTPTNTASVYEIVTIQQIGDQVDNLIIDTEDISDWNLPPRNPAFEEQATLTHFQAYYSLRRAMKFPDVEFSKDALSASDIAPELPARETQEMEEDQRLMSADTAQSLSFKDLVSALDRISRPTEIEDLPLPFDPDDYPVV